MPLLSLFSRNKKPKSTLQSTPSADELSSLSHSPTAEYIIPNKHDTPSSPNGNALFPSDDLTVYSSVAASSSKLRIPFRKNRSDIPTFPSIPPPPPYISRTSTGSDLSATPVRPNRNPPPSKSAIFAAYAGPNGALSTRSLPNDAINPHYHSFSSATSDTLPMTGPTKQNRSFFPWSKSSQKPRTKTKEQNDSIAPKNPPSPDDTSFNLKSFRHIRAPSPTSLSDIPPTMPAARPRGSTNSSESSQRISVAAFREVQARRSTADSPVPSVNERESRSTSRVDLSPSNNPPTSSQTTPVRKVNGGLRRPPVPDVRRSTAMTPTTPRLSVVTVSTQRGSGSAYVETSESEEPEEEEEEESSDDVRGDDDKKGKGPQASKLKAQSEIGHGYTPRSTPKPVPSSRAVSAFLLDTPKISMAPRSQSSLSLYGNGGLRPRASLSTSALLPSEDAKRASVVSGMDGGVFTLFVIFGQISILLDPLLFCLSFLLSNTRNVKSQTLPHSLALTVPDPLIHFLIQFFR